MVEADRNTGKGQKMRKEEVRETGIAGIKQRIKDGKYIVSLDLGREIITDPKTGKRKGSKHVKRGKSNFRRE